MRAGPASIQHTGVYYDEVVKTALNINGSGGGVTIPKTSDGTDTDASYLMFADDLFLIANSKANLRKFVNSTNSAFAHWGLSANVAKSHYFDTGCQGGVSEDLDVQGGAIPGADNVKYLGTTFGNKGGWAQVIQLRTKGAWKTVYKMKKGVWDSKVLSRKQKMRILTVP